MLWRTHVVAGLNALWLLAPLPHVLTPDTVGLLAASAGVGALLPDLDAARSKIRSLDVHGVRPLVPLSDALYQTFGHRGLLHAPAGWLAFGLPCLALSFRWGWEPSLGLFLGYGSHLLADGATRAGIPSAGLYPWLVRTRRLHLLPKRLRVVTGSLAEDAIFPLLASGALLLLLRFLTQSA